MKKKGCLSIAGCLLVLSLVLTACGGGMEKKLVGPWYGDSGTTPSFILFDDGTCEIAGEYGTGKWAVVNDNQLKLTNFYGESQIATIVNIKDGCLTLGHGASTNIFYNEPGKSA